MTLTCALFTSDQEMFVDVPEAPEKCCSVGKKQLLLSIREEEGSV